jgi:hypothetical protein
VVEIERQPMCNVGSYGLFRKKRDPPTVQRRAAFPNPPASNGSPWWSDGGTAPAWSAARLSGDPLQAAAPRSASTSIRFGSDVGALTLYLVILLFSYLTFTLIETPYRERTRRFVARNRARLAAISFVEIVEPEAAKFKSLRSPKFAFLVSLVGIGDRDHRPPL